MKLQSFIFICLYFIFCVASEENEKINRVVSNDLSDEDHFVGGEHNPEYDHEAFLGEEEAAIFDNLTPEESIERLSLIVDKIDQDNDGLVTQEELQEWITHSTNKYIEDNVKEQWEARNPEGLENLPWADYKKVIYGFLDDLDTSDPSAERDSLNYSEMMRRDERRWKAADEDGNDALSLQEFSAFLHPQRAKRMDDVIVLETLEDVDVDKDGKISVDEYIGDLYKGEVGDEEPEWVGIEREHFNTVLDQDKSGYMEKEEVRGWIMPPGYDQDQAEAEAKHLVSEADTDKDMALSKQEIIDNFDLFVGSSATDFGEGLLRHDEF
ncbi:UNVERIFIED_CONTAM: hypothetical protein GTU68_001608 [Idotea baltica]|nr:hypothetical protein [Idotea baltica]